MADYTLSGGGTLALAVGGRHYTDLGLHVDSLRNVVARPGTFADLFPETNDDGLIQIMVDALAEAHLYGVLLIHEADADGLVEPALTTGQMALVNLFAGIRLIRAELFNRATNVRYKAGPAEFEQTFATNILRDIMRALQLQKDAVLDTLVRTGSASMFAMADLYYAVDTNHAPNGVQLASAW